MEENNLNEQIREKIRQIIEDAKGTMKMPPEMEHLLTSICFVMYKAGMDDGFRMSEVAIKVSRDNMKKG